MGKKKVTFAIDANMKEAAQFLYRTVYGTTMSSQFERCLAETLRLGTIPFPISRDPSLRLAGVTSSQAEFLGLDGTWPIPKLDGRATTTLTLDSGIAERAEAFLKDDLGMGLNALFGLFVDQCLYECRVWPTREPRE